MATFSSSNVFHSVLLPKPHSFYSHSAHRGPRGFRTITANLSFFSNNSDDEDFFLKLQELNLNLKHDQHLSFPLKFRDQSIGLSVHYPSIERNSDSVQKHENQSWDYVVREAGVATVCSVKRAFSSMVFMIRELQSMVVKMKETLLCKDLHEILERVHCEVNSSFVWLFQHIFSCTPVLMLSVMLLLANFTVYSMDCRATSTESAQSMTVISVLDDHMQFDKQNEGNCERNSFEVVSSPSVFIGGGGGGRAKPVAGATDDGQWDKKSSNSAIDEDGVLGLVVSEESEMIVWDRMMEEVERMQSSTRNEALMESETIRQLVAPVAVELEKEEKSEYVRTELLYVEALSQEPDNVLLLSNFAQFLYLVLHDHDRAEHYFKRAAGMQPADAEALSLYAGFLWLAKKDLEAAEETYLEAIAADPGNTIYAANYAHFLWNTGGEDTCYLLESPEVETGSL